VQGEGRRRRAGGGRGGEGRKKGNGKRESHESDAVVPREDS